MYAGTPNYKSLETKGMSAIFYSADQESVAGQRRFVRSVRFEQILLIAGAIAGLLTVDHAFGAGTIDIAGSLAAVAFFLGAVIQLTRNNNNNEALRKWYDCRTIAESVKTLAWRYAVGGKPFPLGQDAQAKQLLNERYTQILQDIKGLDYGIALFSEPNQLTPEMQALRAQPLAVRQEEYARQRIRDQIAWYSNKATFNAKNGVFWRNVIFAIEVGATIAAIAKAFGFLSIDVLGVLGTVAAAALSWTQMKQYQNLSRSYTVAAFELGIIANAVDLTETEEDWAQFVEQAEEAISREHTLWRASHSGSLKHDSKNL